MLYSHPGVPLLAHLRQVAESCRHLLQSRKTTFGLPDGLLADLGYLAGATHDVAKATRYFQHYLLAPDHKPEGPKEHALLSALLAKYVVESYLTAFTLDETDRQLLPYLIFTAVKRHHGNLKNFAQELYLEAKADVLSRQIEAFAHEADVQAMLDELLAPRCVRVDWQAFKAYIQKRTYLDDYATFSLDFFDLGDYYNLPADAKTRYFYWHQLLYGTLLLADKSDVILQGLEPARAPLPALEALETYRHRKGFGQPATPLDALKNQAFLETLGALAQTVRPDQHLYSITLPTGLGKTLLSLAVGLTMQRQLGLAAGRLLITIPFTSIIDQNFAVFREVFDDPASDLLLKHHHLAEPTYKTDDDTLDPDKSQFLIETWQSRIVVTTFVQLLESLFSNDKTKLLKLPNLANSVIVLDEVQQVRYALWPLIRQAFHTLGERYGCYFVLMTATQPLIFRPEEEITELVPNYRQYFKNPLLNRTRLINRAHRDISFADFQQEVVTYCTTNPAKQVLVILNTRAATLACFKTVAAALSPDDADVYYLTTLLTPYERRRIIDRVRSYRGSRQQVIVSTQLIEAGVDLSVDTVFRAMAPLDSLIQAAGRANRYQEKPAPGEVYLYSIADLKRPTGMIYGGDLLVKTENVLKNTTETDEHGYLALIEAYFGEIKKQADALDSSELAALQSLDFETLGAFSFIEERQTESVFVQLTAEAEQVWDQYVALYEQENLKPYERRRQFALIKARFYEYVVNVPVPMGQKTIEFDGEKEHFFYVWRRSAPSPCYVYDPDNFRHNTGYAPASQPLTLLL